MWSVLVFVTGLFVGGFVGMVIVAMIVASHETERVAYAERAWRLLAEWLVWYDSGSARYTAPDTKTRTLILQRSIDR